MRASTGRRNQVLGSNQYGQLGYGDKNHRGDKPGDMGDNLPFVDLGGTAQAVAVGSGHTCAVLAAGLVKCWGYNNDGRIGYGDQENRGDNTGEMRVTLNTVDLGTGKAATALSLGALHSCAMLNDGSRKCWGENGQGQLGYEDTDN